MSEPTPLLARSREEIRAARLLQESAFHAQAVSRAYYAAFYAASEALIALGVTRSRHSGVVAAFIQLVVKDGKLDGTVGQALRSLFDQRSAADYGDLPLAPEQSTEALEQAGHVVDAVEQWLSVRP